MISPELLRRYPYFAGLSEDRLVELADAAHEEDVPAGTVLFREGETLCCVFVVVHGAVGLTLAVPVREAQPSVARQLTGDLPTREIMVSSVGTGEVFAWSALVPPYRATATARALTDCRLLAFDATRLRAMFEQDCCFGYRMLQVALQVARDRLRDTRIEALMLAAERGA